jgi:hypothetical protein
MRVGEVGFCYVPVAPRFQCAARLTPTPGPTPAVRCHTSIPQAESCMWECSFWSSSRGTSDSWLYSQYERVGVLCVLCLRQSSIVQGWSSDRRSLVCLYRCARLARCFEWLAGASFCGWASGRKCGSAGLRLVDCGREAGGHAVCLACGGVVGGQVSSPPFLRSATDSRPGPEPGLCW